MQVRKPCVAGRFYPGSVQPLKAELKKFLSHSQKEKAIAVISPHAGYMFSGPIAGHVFSVVEVPDTVILLGPNHTGLGKKVSLMPEGVWETPLGMVDIDNDLAKSLLASSALFKADSEAHAHEHSLEVQLPFIQSLNEKAKIVPITVMMATPKECEDMGRAIAKTIKDSGKEVLIVISSDMNHYECDAVTRKKDREAIDKALALDAKGLIEIAADKDITMCGVLPAAIGISAAKHLGAGDGALVTYATSGEVNGDYEKVVGYAGIVFK